MKTFLEFNTIEIPVVVDNNITYLEISDVELACKMRLNLYESRGYSIRRFNKRVYIPIYELIDRLDNIHKKKDADVRKKFKEKLITIFPKPTINKNPLLSALTHENNDVQLAFLHLNSAIKVLDTIQNENCDKCSVEYDTTLYPCDQCITNPDFITHFKSKDEIPNDQI